MAITQLDSNVALIVIDLQEGIVPLPPKENADLAIKHSVELINEFHAKAQPVVLVNVAGGAPGRTSLPRSGGSLPANWSTLIEQVPQHQDDIMITKHNWGAFINTDLHEQLQARNVSQIVVVGIATSMGVESTARQGYELGYNVVLIEDAMTDKSLVNHKNSVECIFPMLGEIGTTQELLSLLK